jgi:hypothetical protein
MFDWWGGAQPGSSPDSFRKSYPDNPRITGTASFEDCDGTVGDVQGSIDKIFQASLAKDRSTRQ